MCNLTYPSDVICSGLVTSCSLFLATQPSLLLSYSGIDHLPGKEKEVGKVVKRQDLKSAKGEGVLLEAEPF